MRENPEPHQDEKQYLKIIKNNPGFSPVDRANARLDMLMDHPEIYTKKERKYTIVGYNAGGESFRITEFNIPVDADKEKIIAVARTALGKTLPCAGLSIAKLTMKVDEHYVHVLDKMNVAFAKS